jgi:hypothetical protein
MSLKYKILHFEDDPSYVKSLKKLLIEELEDKGYELILEDVPGEPGNLDALLDKEDWDLILMDFYLKQGSPRGDKLISKIRNHEIFTEIIFYSNNHNFKDDILLHMLEGVFYCRERINLFEKTKKIIKLTIKKQQDINNIRGMVIAETIFLENKIENLLIKFFGVDDEIDAVFQKILDPQFGALDTKKKCDLLNKVCKMKKQTFDKRFQEIPKENDEERKKMVDMIAQLNLIHTEVSKLNEEVIKIRNILAHTVESPDKKNTLISNLGKKDIEIIIDDAWCLNTRRNLKKHSDNLDLLFQNL